MAMLEPGLDICKVNYSTGVLLLWSSISFSLLLLFNNISVYSGTECIKMWLFPPVLYKDIGSFPLSKKMYFSKLGE